MSATPEMNFERVKPHAKPSEPTETLLANLTTVITITGPSRESVCQKILAMEQVVGALRGVLTMQTGAMQAHMESPPEALAQCDCRFCCLNKARAALAAWEGKT